MTDHQHQESFKLYSPGEALATIRARHNSLRPAERTVSAFLLDHADRVIDLTAQQVADEAGTSRATVVRTCQELGFAGYQQLRVLLGRDIEVRKFRREQHDGSAAADPSEGGTGIAPGAQTIGAKFRQIATSIVTSATLLDESAADRATEVLATANRVVVIGNGLSRALAGDTASRFRRIGIIAEAPQDAFEQQIMSRLLRPGDCLLAISGSGADLLTVRAAAGARAGGASTIAITGFDRTALTDVSDTVVIVSAPDATFEQEITVTSRVAQTVLVEAILLRLETILGEDAERAKELALEAVSSFLVD